MTRRLTIQRGRTAGQALSAALNDQSVIKTPKRKSFLEFLVMDARVPADSSDAQKRGTYVPYTFTGREALKGIVEMIDTILGNTDGKTRKDATLSLAGGAQWGKSMLQHALMAYSTGQLFRSTLLFLPDVNLVNDLVQTKFRPNVVDQIPWFSEMLKLGVVVNDSGKALHRIGAFNVTDGKRRANGMFAGLGKIPTSVSGDIALEDEVDDVDVRNEKFVRGRISASDLKFIFKIGTQRVHGRGMNKAWRDGSQGIIELHCPKCDHRQNPEENFPQIVCLVTPGQSQPARLNYAGGFSVADKQVATIQPGQAYYLGCLHCGGRLNRFQPHWFHRRPDELKRNNPSFRISQLGIAAIDLETIVKDWYGAVQDEDKMVVFRCDVLGIPKSTAQKLEPEILDRARRIEVFQSAPPIQTFPRYAGLDMGQRCWFVAREVQSPHRKRVIWAEQIPLHQVGVRVPHLVNMLQVGCTFVDQMPETKESRTLAMTLNGLSRLAHWPVIPPRGRCHVAFPGCLKFQRLDNGEERWTGLKAAVVRFDKKKVGGGIEQSLDVFDGPNGGEIYVPLIQCNRFESVDSIVREFLTPAEGELDASQLLGLRTEPAVRLPQNPKGGSVWEEFDNQHLAGSEREKENDGSLGDYVDGVPNHFLFAHAYARLAEVVGGRSIGRPFAALRMGRVKPERSGV